MKDIRCPRCGANSFTKNGVNLICDYCGSILVAEKDEEISTLDPKPINHGMGLNSDIEILLKKCKLDPMNARRYANLILDIDPTNKDALKYLK